VSRYFRNVHAPLLLTKAGKAIVLLAFTGLLAFGIYVSFYHTFDVHKLLWWNNSLYEYFATCREL